MGDSVAAWWLSSLGDWSGVLPVAGCQVVVGRGHGLPIPELLLVEMLWRSHRVATWARSWSDLSSGWLSNYGAFASGGEWPSQGSAEPVRVDFE